MLRGHGIWKYLCFDTKLIFNLVRRNMWCLPFHSFQSIYTLSTLVGRIACTMTCVFVFFFQHTLLNLYKLKVHKVWLYYKLCHLYRWSNHCRMSRAEEIFQILYQRLKKHETEKYKPSLGCLLMENVKSLKTWVLASVLLYRSCVISRH